MSGNPFRFNKPTPPDRFFGRRDIVVKIARDLYNISGDSYAVVGGKRFGKSSLLLALEDDLLKCLAGTELINIEDKDFDAVVPVFVSLKALEQHTSYSDVLGMMRHKLKMATSGSKSSLFKEPLLELFPEYAETTSSPASLGELEAEIRKVIETAFEVMGLVRIVFLIDEMDEIVDCEWTDDVFGKLRSLIYDSSVRNYVRLILAGSGGYLRVDEKGSPLFNAVTGAFLEPFSQAGIQELLDQVESISPDVVSEVVKQAGGNPFILQYLLHYLFEEGFAFTNPDTVRAKVRHFKHHRLEDLEGWWMAIGKEGRYIYYLLAQARDWMTHSDLREAASDPDLELGRGLKTLCYHGIVSHDGTYQKYRVSGSLFQDWASSKQHTGGVEMKEEYVDFEVRVDSYGNIKAKSEQAGERESAVPTAVPSNIELTLNLIEQNTVNEKILNELGKCLYDIIFAEEIDKHFNQTEAVARERKQRLRIRLTIDADSLACLPWEFTYREEAGYYLSVNPNTVLSRYLDLPIPKSRVRRREGPLDMLIIIANPSDQTPLDPDKWESIIVDALEKPIKDKSIITRVVKHATYEEISHTLLEQQPDIVQFVGHGIYEDGKGYLALVNDSGKTWLVDDASFADMFLGADDNLGLVNLTACEGAKTDSPKAFLGIAPQMVQRGVPAVVAMQYSVLISTGKIFLRNFYKALAARRSVDWAVQHARNSIAIKVGKGNREFATPVLYMRAKDGKIF
jgi:hypothetical protein